MIFTGERFIPNIDLDIELEIEHLQRYYSVKDLVKDKIVVDAACGEGYGTFIMCETAKRVYGIDVSADAVNEANKKYKNDNIGFINSSVEKLPFENNSVDVVISFETIEHIEEQLQSKFLKEVRRILKQDGFLVISTPNKKIYSDEYNYKNEFHKKEFYEEEFISFLKSEFQYLKIYNQYFEVASLIDNPEFRTEHVNTFRLDNYVHEGKYLIAIAGNEELDHLPTINSVFNCDENKYKNSINRILELQEEVELRNSHIRKIDLQIKEKGNEIIKLNFKVEELQEEVELRNFHINKLDLEIKENGNEIIRLNSRVEELQEEVSIRNSHINKLDLEIKENGNEMLRLNSRIEELQEEVEVRNSHINKIDLEIKENGKVMIRLNSRIEELQEEVEVKNSHINKINFEIKENGNEIVRLNSRVKELEDEVEVKNSHINKTDLEIKENGKEIIRLNSRVEELSIWGQSQDKEIVYKNEQLEEKNKEIYELKDIMYKLNGEKDNYSNKILELENKINEFEKQCKNMENISQEANQTIINQKGHIEQLLQKERELNNIYQSGGWKLLTNYYKLRDSVFPEKTKRRLFTKLIYKAIKNPKSFSKRINFKNINKFTYYLKNENVEKLEKRLNTYLEKYEELKQFKIETFEVKDENFEKLVFIKENSPLVSIIIPVYNQWNYTYSCLKSILQNTTDIPYEIIIADDVSTDDTVKINKFIQNVNVVRNEKNMGFLLNCNNAAEFARGKHILFLNNDTNVQKEWLKYLVELIEKDEKIGMVGSKLVYPDGRLQEAGGIIWNDASGWNFGRLDEADKPEYNYVREVDYISGAAIMIRKELWEQIGGFDKRFIPAYYEDTDLAFEVRKHGYKVVYQPKSVVVHFEGVSNGTDDSVGIKKYQRDNKEKFFRKWNDELKTQFTNSENLFYAHNRSKNKKTILVIDHYVPNFDKDAGGKCTYHYLKTFKDMGLNVVFLGDNFFPHQPYTDIIQQMGINVLYGDWYYNNYKDWLKENGKYFDYVYLNRPHIAIKYIDLLREYSNAKIIYFGHDLHYLRELRNYEVDKNPELLKASEEWKTIETELFQKADVIYAVGTYEQKIIRDMFSEKIVRNIPVYIYDDICKNTSISFNERKNIMFVGGFNHKPNVDAAIWFSKEILPIIKNQIPNLKFYIIGSKPTDEVSALASDDIVVTGFISDEELKAYYSNCRVVVAPLRFGAGMKGKVVEAMYYQTPIITTTVGAEGFENIDEVIQVYDKEREFADAVINLYNDLDTLQEMSNKEYNYIKKYFSKERVIKILENDFV